MLMKRLLLCNARVCVIYENPREEHDVEVDHGYDGSWCRARVADEMEVGANDLHDFRSLVLMGCKARARLWGYELGVMPFLEGYLVIVSLMFHGGFFACVDARVEDLEFKNSNPRMDM